MVFSAIIASALAANEREGQITIIETVVENTYQTVEGYQKEYVKDPETDKETEEVSYSFMTSDQESVVAKTGYVTRTFLRQVDSLSKEDLYQLLQMDKGSLVEIIKDRLTDKLKQFDNVETGPTKIHVTGDYYKSKTKVVNVNKRKNNFKVKTCVTLIIKEVKQMLSKNKKEPTKEEVHVPQTQPPMADPKQSVDAESVQDAEKPEELMKTSRRL